MYCIPADSPLGGIQGHAMNISGGGRLWEMLHLLTLPSPLASSLIPFSPSQSLPALLVPPEHFGAGFLPIFVRSDLLGPHPLSLGLLYCALNGLPAWSCTYRL